MLSQDDYYQAIQLTQIVSVDLLVLRGNSFLLGKRTNQPAKGYFFTPGGRVFKNETIPEAAKRILKDEVGIVPPKDHHFSMVGVHEHRYPNNFRDYKFGTHYVSIAYSINVDSLPGDIEENMKKQHSEIKWMRGYEILKSPEVHELVKEFFRDKPSNRVNS